MDVHANFAVSTVATAPSPATSGTSLVVAAGEGTRFPTVPFNAVIKPISTRADPSNAEIVRVTNISTDTFTITRTQESTSARTVIVGDLIYAAVTAKTLTDIEAAHAVISDQTVGGGGAATIDFTSIPGTYRELRVILIGRSNAGATSDLVNITLNNDTSGNYDESTLRGVNSGASSGQDVAGTNFNRIGISAASSTANYPGMVELSIPFYADTTFYKLVQMHGAFEASQAASGLNTFQVHGWWRNTAAVTRITFTTATGSFIGGSRAVLYGIG